MGTKKKTFDCVEMKNRIQRQLRQEYEARKSQFASYADFINATANESEQIRTFRQEVARTRTTTGKGGYDRG
jgi:hypothetical protein